MGDEGREISQAVFGRPPRRGNQPHDVIEHRIVDERAAGGALQAEQLLCVEHLSRRRRFDAHATSDLRLLAIGGVVHGDFHQEPVALRLG